MFSVNAISLQVQNPELIPSSKVRSHNSDYLGEEEEAVDENTTEIS